MSSLFLACRALGCHACYGDADCASVNAYRAKYGEVLAGAAAGDLTVWFPRVEAPEASAVKTTPIELKTALEDSHNRFASGGYAAGQERENYFGKLRPKKKKTATKAKELEQIGEGLTKAVFKNQLGIKLTKVPLVISFTYHGIRRTSTDVDFTGFHAGRDIRVEAKTWWSAKKGFPLARFSDRERGFLRQAVARGYHAWVTIALLDGEPTRGACNNLYVLSWTKWLEIEAALRGRAAGRFEGKSLRRRDLDLLDGLAIARHGRRWVVPGSHWLARLD